MEYPGPSTPRDGQTLWSASRHFTHVSRTSLSRSSMGWHSWVSRQATTAWRGAPEQGSGERAIIRTLGALHACVAPNPQPPTANPRRQVLEHHIAHWQGWCSHCNYRCSLLLLWPTITMRCPKNWARGQQWAVFQNCPKRKKTPSWYGVHWTVPRFPLLIRIVGKKATYPHDGCTHLPPPHGELGLVSAPGEDNSYNERA